jgi:metal-responsive CopG/Arc/MetJ family transcriptional regulator
MRSRSSTAFAARLPAREAEQVEEALEQTGWSQSEFVRRALQYYISQNPDDIPTLYAEHSVNRLLTEMEGKYA